MPSESELQSRLDLALSAAREAGDLTLKYFLSSELEVERKSDATPVTIADRQAEELLRDRIAAAFPDDGILGEEFPEVPGTSGFRWILDPIDGTKCFVHGVPLYGTLVGVEFETKAVVGVDLIPAVNECVYAAKGLGCWYTRGNSEPVRAHVSETPKLAEGLFCMTEIVNFSKYNKEKPFTALRETARMTRGWGDCFGYMMVATGRAELMADPKMSVWDAAALQPILEEAGGTFTDWQGNPTIHAGEGVATNGKIFDEVMGLIRDNS